MAPLYRAILIASTLLASWLGMQAVHELGHVLGAWVSGGHVRRVVLHPLAISRTDLADNPSPLLVVWAGPFVGTLLPLLIWGVAAALRVPGAFILRFFAGFCLVANGAYLAAGSLWEIGDSGDMLRHGSAIWQLWLFGAAAVPIGLGLWHRQGRHFGLGADAQRVDVRVALAILAASVGLAALGWAVGGD